MIILNNLPLNSCICWVTFLYIYSDQNVCCMPAYTENKGMLNMKTSSDILGTLILQCLNIINIMYFLNSLYHRKHLLIKSEIVTECMNKIFSHVKANMLNVAAYFGLLQASDNSPVKQTQKAASQKLNGTLPEARSITTSFVSLNSQTRVFSDTLWSLKSL